MNFRKDEFRWAIRNGLREEISERKLHFMKTTFLLLLLPSELRKEGEFVIGCGVRIGIAASGRNASSFTVRERKRR